MKYVFLHFYQNEEWYLYALCPKPTNGFTFLKFIEVHIVQVRFFNNEEKSSKNDQERYMVRNDIWSGMIYGQEMVRKDIWSGKIYGQE